MPDDRSVAVTSRWSTIEARGVVVVTARCGGALASGRCAGPIVPTVPTFIPAGWTGVCVSVDIFP